MVNSALLLTTATFLVAGSTHFLTTTSTTVEAAFIKHRIPARRRAAEALPASSIPASPQQQQHLRLARRQAGASGYCRKRSPQSQAQSQSQVQTSSSPSTAATTGPSRNDTLSATTLFGIPLSIPSTSSGVASSADSVSDNGSGISSSDGVATCGDGTAVASASLPPCSGSSIATTFAVATSYVDITVTETISSADATATATTATATTTTTNASSHLTSPTPTQVQHYVSTGINATQTGNATVAKTGLSSSVSSSSASSLPSALPSISSDINNSSSSVAATDNANTTSSIVTTTTDAVTTSKSVTNAATAASMTSVLSATTTISSSIPSSTPLCPAGSSWQTLSDDFTKQQTLDTSKWSMENGAPSQVTFGADGMFMHLDANNTNIVLQSNTKWLAPVNMTASIKSAQAPGVISCLIFGQAKTDEIDLELVEGTWQTPLWQDGKRLEPLQDVTYTIANTSHEHVAWIFSDKQVVPFAKVHDWSLSWQSDRLTWSTDGRQLLDVRKMDNGSWPAEALPLRWGPWATDAGWAGQLNWTKTPEAVMQLKSISIEGCQLDEGK